MIMQKDYLRCGLPVYTINCYIEELGTVFKDGSHIVYVNGSYRGNDPLGKLMSDFACKEAKEAAIESAIKTTIEDAIPYGMDKELILDKVNKKYGISKEEAEKLYNAYVMMAV